MDGSSIKLLRNKLGVSQRFLCVLAAKDGIVVSQATISLMETGKLPVPRNYAEWLSKQVYGRYRRIEDMPAKRLAWAIKNREVIQDGGKGNKTN